MWKERPELHGVQRDATIFHDHFDFLDLLVSIKFSPVSSFLILLTATVIISVSEFDKLSTIS